MRLLKFAPILVLIACSPELRVHTDFDRDISIQKLTAYDWLPVAQIESKNNPIYFNELTDKRIKNAVDKQLKEKGYVRSQTSAQMLIHYHITIENRATVGVEPFGYSYGHYWLNNELNEYRYDEGTLIIDFMDLRNCELIWRGWAVSVLNEDNISEELINRAVIEIFKKFPLSAAKEVTLP